MGTSFIASSERPRHGGGGGGRSPCLRPVLGTWRSVQLIFQPPLPHKKERHRCAHTHTRAVHSTRSFRCRETALARPRRHQGVARVTGMKARMQAQILASFSRCGLLGDFQWLRAAKRTRNIRAFTVALGRDTNFSITGSSRNRHRRWQSSRVVIQLCYLSAALGVQCRNGVVTGDLIKARTITKIRANVTYKGKERSSVRATKLKEV